jgi:hypothetical protein
MAKTLGQVELIVRGPEGGPYEAFFQGVIGSSDDALLKKPVVKELDTPDFNQTVTAFMTAETTALKSDEGIS